MNHYRKMQEKIREEAIEWQNSCEEDLSYLELALIGDYFRKYGKRYGLLREFRENGIPC